MKKTLILLSALLLLAIMPATAKVTHLLPKPQQITEKGGNAFALSRKVTINDPTGCKALEKFFTTNNCTIGEGGALVNVTLVSSISGSYDYELAGFDNEAYTISVTEDKIEIKAIKPIGVIRAAQTLTQLAEGYKEAVAAVEAVEIKDWAAFKLRGYMHDVGRSFISVDELKKHIRLLSRFKVNCFHWHFTENQAWRLQINAYPQLTSNASMTRFAGKYYTQEECREVAAYAQEHGITVIPEIDMPGHSEAFVRAMGFDMQTDKGVEALKVILDEVAALFPEAPYIHIGADEKGITYPNFLGIMIDHLHNKGKKVVVWNPISGVNVGSTAADMTQMWSTAGTQVSGKANIDCRYNYTNHFDVFADVVGIYRSNIYYEQKGNKNVAGTISAYWNDRKTPTEEDIIKQNNMYANVIASAERAWIGGGKQYIEVGGTTLPNSGDEYDEFADWERRFLFHKQRSLKNEPIPYVKQTNVRWRITDAFPNGGNMNATLAPETEGLKDSYTVDGVTYGTGMATGAGIYLRHTWGSIIPTYFSNPQLNTTAYAWTYVYSETAQTVGAQIEFQNYGRSEKDTAPDKGKWDRKGSRIWLNDEEILPPTWDNTGKSINNEVDLKNENFSARKPVQVSLKAGWNKVFIKLPYVTANGVRLNKWMFTFVLTDLDGRDAIDGLIYSPNKCMDETAEQIAASISEIKKFVASVTGTQPGFYSPETANELNAVIEKIEATFEQELTAEERAQQIAELNKAYDAFKAYYPTTAINQPKASTDEVSYYYTLSTPLRDNRYATSKGAGNEMYGEQSISKAAKWKFVSRTDGTYNIVNYSDGSYISPSSSYNTALRTQSSAPTKGWTLKQADAPGFFIIVSGTTQFNQTNSGQSYKVYNWGNGNNITDTGCKYLIAESDIVDAGETNPDTQESYDIEILASKGNFTASNNNGTWHSRWESSEVEGFSLSTSANNMTTSNDCIAGYSGLSGSSTYTLAAPEGYMITAIKFDYVNTDAGTHQLSLSLDGKSYTSTSTKKSLDVKVSNPSRIVTFTQTGDNKGITFSNYIVSIAIDTNEPETLYEVFSTATAADIPYRIPAIAMAKNGDLIAVADYRHSRADIGMASYGRIDLHARISKDNGASWDKKFSIVDGKGSSSPDFMHVGFGDPCIVADRESNRVLVLSCAGNVSFPGGTRNNHQNIARFYSNDNGASWSDPVDIADKYFYNQFDNSPLGPVMAMFIGSGKIHQSRYVKVNDYYRLYCAVLAKDRNGAYINFVFYSDNFGESWDVLGTKDAPHCTGADEPKVEELPNGNIILSTRMNGGRHFNIFTFTNAEKAEGSWGTQATSNKNVNGVVAENNSCNGEIMILPVVRNEDGAEMWIALQSLPFGSGRNNVGIYYKELASGADYNTPANFAKNWDGRHQVTQLPSAYSTMCLQKDSTIAFLYEEDTYGVNAYGGYCIMYKNYSLEKITNGAYSILKGRLPEAQPDQPSEATIALIAEAKEFLKLKGVGYPTDEPRVTLKAAIATAEDNPTENAGATLEVELEKYLTSNDVVLPAGGNRYTITMVAKSGTRYYLNYTGKDIAVVKREEGNELPESAIFTCEDNNDGTVTLSTADGKYLVYHSKYSGVNWLQGGGDTDGMQDTKDKMSNITFGKMQPSGNVEASSREIFGLLTWYSMRGYDINKKEDSYGYVVIKTDGSDYDGASAPFWNNNYSSGLLIERIPEPMEKFRVKEVNSGTYLHISSYNANNQAGPIGSVIMSEKEESDDQIFSMEEAEDGAVYLVSANGYYIVCRPWNVDACDTGEKTALTFNYIDDTQFYITNANGYFKIENVSGTVYPFCDAKDINIAAIWELESLETTDIIEINNNEENSAIYDLQGRKVENPSKGIYIINGKKILIK